MSPKRSTEDPVQQEVERLMEMLRIFVRTLGYGNAEIARRTNLAHANVGRYFRGEARVPLDFVIAAIRALGLEYKEFFELAYADQPEQPSAARQRIERILRILPARREAPAEPPEPEPPKRPPTMTRAEIEAMIDELRQGVASVIDRQAREAAAPEPEPKARPKTPRPKVKPGSKTRKKPKA